MNSEIQRLRRDVRILELYSVVLTSAALIALLGAFRAHRSDDQILRARGLVIVDAAGRERILIGAPIPAAANRVRTDTSDRATVSSASAATTASCWGWMMMRGTRA